MLLLTAMMRVHTELYGRVLKSFLMRALQQSLSAPQPLPVKLRPIVKTKSCELDLHHTTSEENIVVNLNKLSDLIASFQHDCSDPSANVKIESRNICTYYQFMFSFQ